MPPKKTRAQATFSSQPLPDTKSTRASGRKRRLSDASEVSERPSSSQSNANANAAAKRRKRGRPAASVEPEVIVEEHEQEEELNDLNTHHQETIQLGGDATIERTVEESEIEVSQPRSKTVTFEAGANTTSSTATNVTPHPRKTVKMKHQRATLSPAPGAVKRLRLSGGRSSLPPSLSQNDDDADARAIVQELQFAPLSQVLDERVRRRLRRSHLSEEQNDIEDHAKRDSRTQQELGDLRSEAADKQQRIDELSLELETQRQYAIDASDENDAVRAADLERELTVLRNELADHMETHGLDSDDMHVPDNNMLVLDSQEQIAYPELPGASSSQAVKTITNFHHDDGDSKIVLHEFSQSGRASLGLSHAQANWNLERTQFQEAIIALQNEANKANARMQILQIELHGLGFGFKEKEDSVVVLKSIRTSLDNIREGLEDVVPDSVPEDATTADLIEIMVSNLKEFAIRLRLQDQELYEKGVLVADLGNQIKGLLNHLTDAEIRKENLEKQWTTLDQANEAKDRELEELDEDRQAVYDECEELKRQLEEKADEARALGADHADSVATIEKLTLSLENYRKEETRMTELITRMEKEHRTEIAKMNKEREETVRDLEEQLDAETALRKEAEVQADERQTTIARMEIEFEIVSTERDQLKNELENTKAERDAALQELETAEGSLEEKNAQVEDLEGRVDRLGQELDELTTQLEELRKNNEAERRQREAAETDLDDRNVEIEELNNKLRDSGKEANELRLKLFQLQQDHARNIKELEQQMSDRDQQYQEDIATEVARRQKAEELAAERADTIRELEARLEDTEEKMLNDLTDRDERIAALERVIVERDEEIKDLRLDLKSAENTLDVEKTNHEERVEDLTGSIAALQETISQHEVTIEQLEAQAERDNELHNSETEDRNAEIANLHADVTKYKTATDELKRAKAGLERRVEEEATAMLNMQNVKEDEIDLLKTTINDKQVKILNVEKKAIEADERWQEVMGAHEAEIEELKTEAFVNEESFEELAEAYQAGMQRFREYKVKSEATIAKLQDAANTLKVLADEEGDSHKADGDMMMEDYEAVDVVGELKARRTTVVTTSTKTVIKQSQGGASASHSASGAKKGRGRKSRRGVDSGIGMNGEEEPEMAA